MTVQKHAAVSFVVSALLFVGFKKLQMSVACFLTGILIDLDHVFDYCVNHELRNNLRYFRHPRELAKFLSSRYNSSSRVYKPLHSVELLIPALFLYVFGIWNDVATGMLIGFVCHLIMDFLSLGHIGTISMISKANRGFSRGTELLKQRLSKLGRDVNKCQKCGAYGETILHKDHCWYIGFTRRGLSKVNILCPDCHDEIHNKEHQRTSPQ